MKYLVVFVGATARSLFASVIGWTLNVITFVALWVSVTFQSLPLWLWFAVAVINVFIATFLSWKKERLRVNKLESEIEEIKSSIPNYSILVGDIKKYSIESIIESTEHEVSILRETIKNSNKPKPLQLKSGGLFASALMSIRMPAIGSLIPGYESNEDKLTRLKSYLNKLIEYENNLGDTYRVSLSIESTRHDKNIEIEVSSSDTYKMTVQDEYETRHVPSTSAPGAHYGDYMRGVFGDVASITQVAGRYYIQSSANGNVAVSELAYLNANRPTSIFDSTFYIHTKKRDPLLKFKIHSTHLSVAQVITEKINLEGTPITRLHEKE